MNDNFIIEVITNHGFPVFLTICIGYILFYIWKFVTEKLKPALTQILENLNHVAETIKTDHNDIDKEIQKVSIITILRDKNRNGDQ